tara:strand:- start:716 stop:961 length:246 start_codon:yes stop_codon:yes gene_type:complete
MDNLKKLFNKNNEEENTLKTRFIQNVSLEHNLSILSELNREYNTFNDDLNYNEIVSQYMETSLRCLNIINEKLKNIENKKN